MTDIAHYLLKRSKSHFKKWILGIIFVSTKIFLKSWFQPSLHYESYNPPSIICTFSNFSLVHCDDLSCPSATFWWIFWRSIDTWESTLKMEGRSWCHLLHLITPSIKKGMSRELQTCVFPSKITTITAIAAAATSN